MNGNNKNTTTKKGEGQHADEKINFIPQSGASSTVYEIIGPEENEQIFLTKSPDRNSPETETIVTSRPRASTLEIMTNSNTTSAPRQRATTFTTSASNNDKTQKEKTLLQRTIGVTIDKSQKKTHQTSSFNSKFVNPLTPEDIAAYKKDRREEERQSALEKLREEYRQKQSSGPEWEIK